jgi:hypothetical protein
LKCSETEGDGKSKPSASSLLLINKVWSPIVREEERRGERAAIN